MSAVIKHCYNTRWSLIENILRNLISVPYGIRSSLFIILTPGVKYLPGGVKSGFVHVDPDDEPKRLFQVKGKRNIKVKQVRSNSFFDVAFFGSISSQGFQSKIITCLQQIEHLCICCGVISQSAGCPLKVPVWCNSTEVGSKYGAAV